MDNGPEFIAKALVDWAATTGIALVHIQPDNPMQNTYIKRFSRSFRTEVLDCYVFEFLQEVRAIAAGWLHGYNYERPP